jgi:hypothetical protein
LTGVSGAFMDIARVILTLLLDGFAETGQAARTGTTAPLENAKVPQAVVCHIVSAHTQYMSNLL